MHGALCLLVVTLCPGSPHTTCGLSGSSHTNLLSGQSFAMTPHVSGTWSCHSKWTTIHTRDCGRLWCIIRARYPNQEVGATWVPPDAVVVQTIRVSLRDKTYTRPLVSSKI